MAALTVILAPPGTTGAVLDVLRDWSALGVIEPFLWVRSDAVNGEVAPALKITGGTAVGTTVQAQVADGRNDLRRNDHISCWSSRQFCSAGQQDSDSDQRFRDFCRSCERIRQRARANIRNSDPLWGEHLHWSNHD